MRLTHSRLRGLSQFFPNFLFFVFRWFLVRQLSNALLLLTLTADRLQSAQYKLLVTFGECGLVT
jgi:hypothetical protein